MLKWKNKKFEVQSVHKCINYDWNGTNKHCCILYSESLDKPINAYRTYQKCYLDEGLSCPHYNIGVQLIEKLEANK